MAVSILGLMAGTGLGLLVLAGLAFGVLPLDISSAMFGIMVAFVVLQSVAGFRSARILLQFANARRRKGLACPACGAPPPRGDYWICSRCRDRFDMFEEPGVCPSCGQESARTMCPECHRSTPVAEWFPAVSLAETADEVEPGESV